MSILVHSLSRMALFFLCCFPVASFSAPPAPQQAVLVLATDNYTYPFFFKLHGALNDTLKQDLKESFSLYPETLDVNRLSSQAYRDQIHKLLQEKYRNTPIKAIVAIGNGALRYLLDANPRPWPDVPVVFTTVSANAAAKMQLPPNVTGHTMKFSLESAVKLSRLLLPETKRMVLIGNTPENDNYRPYFGEEIQSLYEQIEFLDLRGKQIEEVRQTASSLPQDTVIYYTHVSDDGSGRRFVSLDALTSIAAAANQPILVDNEINIGAGPLGGMVFDPETQGRDAGKLVQRLLQGESAASIPIASSEPHLIFDWRQLKRWKLDPQQLPAQSEVRFYEPNVWERYRWQLAGIAAILVLQFILMLALLLEHRRRSRAEQASRRRLAEIAHMNRTTTATFFSATIAHELNQPLAAILSNAEAAELFLKADPPAIKDVQEILADIRRDDKRASELIQRMRELLKKSESVVQVINLNEVIKHTLQFLASEAKNRNVTLAAYLSYHHLFVFADPVQLQQVLINLVINSMDAMADMPENERLVSVKTSSGDVSAEICVSDSGPGFGKNLDRIFESFFTTKPQGMGLGMSITSEIIHAHGGQIRAENNPDGGAIVRVTLPLHKGQST